eukprot:GEMP01005839.1.p1 GENE.GEMP01005839.1~~GEMP01005839.1.p1  ORF type:complete len:795 (+),score=139.79 GEMP01005839.1:303-2687(+)
MEKSLQNIANQAFVQLVVNVVGCVVLFCFYYNYRVLEAYFLALFWAVMCSIPMFQLKTWLIKSIVTISCGERNAKFGNFSSLAPYKGIFDFFTRDPLWLCILASYLLHWWLRPMFEMFTVADREASKPFFGIMSRCWIIYFIKIFRQIIWGNIWWLTLVAGIIFMAVITIRLARNACECSRRSGFNERISHQLRFSVIQALADRVRAVFYQVFVFVATTLLADYVNPLLAIAIMVCCVLASSLLTFTCSYFFFQEAVVIWQASNDFVSNNLFYQKSVLPALQTVTSGLGNNTRFQEGYDQVLTWAEKNIADFEVAKYVFSNFWDDSVDESCVASPPMAAGYTPNCTENMTAVPKNFTLTTNLIRSLAQGNFTAAASIAPNAYAEIMALHDSFSSGEISNAIVTAVLSSSTSLLRVMAFAIVLVLHWLASAFDFIIQALVFLTALFYLLRAQRSVLDYLDQLLQVIDSSGTLFDCCDRALRAVLVSALKMSLFHSGFTFLLFSFNELPVVFVPTALTTLISLVPLVPPVIVPALSVPYLWMHGHMFQSGVAFLLSFCVWWSVPASIYAEIPKSHPWLTGLAVVLGVSHFGVRGAVLGPLLVTVPLICAELLVVFNESRPTEAGSVASSMAAMRTSIASFRVRMSRANSIDASQECRVPVSKPKSLDEFTTAEIKERNKKIKGMLLRKEKSKLFREIASPKMHYLPIAGRDPTIRGRSADMRSAALPRRRNSGIASASPAAPITPAIRKYDSLPTDFSPGENSDNPRMMTSVRKILVGSRDDTPNSVPVPPRSAAA